MIDILLIVAHPDDEVIWFGSSLYELIRLGDINVNVINLWGILEPPGSMQAVTPGYKDIDRKEQFYEVCKNMNVCKLSEVQMEAKNKPVGMINRRDLKELNPVEPKEY